MGLLQDSYCLGVVFAQSRFTRIHEGVLRVLRDPLGFFWLFLRIAEGFLGILVGLL